MECMVKKMFNRIFSWNVVFEKLSFFEGFIYFSVSVGEEKDLLIHSPTQVQRPNTWAVLCCFHSTLAGS